MGKPVSIEFLFRAQIIDSDGRVRTVHDRDKLAIPSDVSETSLAIYLQQVPLAFIMEVARRAAATAAGTDVPEGPAADAVETAPHTPA